MNNEITIQDKKHNFFIVDNEVIDNYNLDPHTYLYYSYLCRYSKDGEAYLCKSTLAKKHKCSRNRFVKAEKILIELGLIKIIDINKTNNIKIYNVLKVKKAVSAQNIVPLENNLVLTRNTTVRPENNLVLTRNINKTYNKTNTNNKNKGASKSRISKKDSSKDDILKNQKDKILLRWQEETNQKINSTKRLDGYIYACIKREGYERTGKTVVRYANDEWRQKREAWKLPVLLTDPVEFARYAPAEISDSKIRKFEFDDMTQGEKGIMWDKRKGYNDPDWIDKVRNERVSAGEKWL